MLDPVADARRRLGMARRFAEDGRADDAVAIAETAVAVIEQARPEGHPDIAATCIELSMLHEGLSQYDKAEKYARKAIVVTEEYSSADERQVRLRVGALGCLATVERIRDRLGSAEVLYNSALEMAAKSPWPSPAEQVGLMCGLGVVYQFGGKLGEAERLFQQAVTLAGNDRGVIAANAWHHLAELDLLRGQFVAGESHAARALGMRENALGPNHPAVARDRVLLAAILTRLGKLDIAEKLFRRSIATLERILPEYHYDLAVACQEFGMLMAARGNVAAAGRLTQRCLDIKTKLLGRNHPEVAQALETLALFN
ncbi:tetratricopeptide repeat protein [Actinocrispum sp. NPDC049592]|uniref:tetratricopeptide repeat protein n=1 Tax=Actinocrispum sp. NPDC049592 TaxID=3154835 RepID=UPI00342F019E